MFVSPVISIGRNTFLIWKWLWIGDSFCMPMFTSPFSSRPSPSVGRCSPCACWHSLCGLICALMFLDSFYSFASSSIEFCEPWAGGFNWDISFSTECFKISYCILSARCSLNWLPILLHMKSFLVLAEQGMYLSI